MSSPSSPIFSEKKKSQLEGRVYCAPGRPSENINGQCCCTQQIQSWPHTIRFHLFGALKGSLSLCGSWGTAEHYTPVAADEAQQQIQGWNTGPSSKVEEDCWLRWRLNWKNKLYSQQCCSRVLWNVQTSNLENSMKQKHKALLSE